STQGAFDFSQRAHLSGFLGRDFFEDVKNPFGGVTIPKRRLLRSFPTRAVQRCRSRVDDPRRVGADDNIRSQLDSDRTLSILAQREARNAESRCLLLNAAGISQNEPRLAVKRQKIEITK